MQPLSSWVEEPDHPPPSPFTLCTMPVSYSPKLSTNRRHVCRQTPQSVVPSTSHPSCPPPPPTMPPSYQRVGPLSKSDYSQLDHTLSNCPLFSHTLSHAPLHVSGGAVSIPATPLKSLKQRLLSSGALRHAFTTLASAAQCLSW